MERKYYDFVEQLIKENRKFEGNEGIFDEVVEDVYARAATILETVRNDDVIKSYLRKAVSTSLISVIKKNNLNTRTNKHNIESIIAVQEAPVEINRAEPEENQKLPVVEAKEEAVVEEPAVNIEEADLAAEVSDTSEGTVEELSEEKTEIAKASDEEIEEAFSEVVDVFDEQADESALEELEGSPDMPVGVEEADADAGLSELIENSAAEESDFEELDLDELTGESVEDTATDGEEQPEMDVELPEEDSIVSGEITDNAEEVFAEEAEVLSEVQETEPAEVLETPGDIELLEIADSEEDVIEDFVPESLEPETVDELEISEDETEDIAGEENELLEEAPVKFSDEVDKTLVDKVINGVSSEEAADILNPVEPESELYTDIDDITVTDGTDLEELSEVEPVSGMDEVSDLQEFSGESFELDEQGSDMGLEEFEDDGSVASLMEVSDASDGMLDMSEPSVLELEEDDSPALEDKEDNNFVPPSYDCFDYDVEALSVDTHEVLDSIIEFDEKYPDRKILEICKLKYKENMSVQDVAEKLAITETDVIDALSDIIYKVEG